MRFDASYDLQLPMQRKTTLRWLRLAALAAALAAVVILASGISFWHTDSAGSDATCPICHVAHTSSLPVAMAHIPAASLAVEALVPAQARVGHAPPFSVAAPPRAPPA